MTAFVVLHRVVTCHLSGSRELSSYQINVRDLPSDSFSGPLSEGFNIITLLSLLAERLPTVRHTLLDLNSFDEEDR